MRFIGKSSFFVLEFVGLSVALFLVLMIHDPPELVYLHYVGKHRGFVFCAEKGLCKNYARHTILCGGRKYYE